MTQWGLDTLFNPAKRHMDEEKRRLQSTRSEVGDNSGGKRIDLESGKVVIAHPDADEAGGAGKTDAAKADAAKSEAAKSEAAKSDAALSPAAARAAKRRARKTP